MIFPQEIYIFTEYICSNIIAITDCCRIYAKSITKNSTLGSSSNFFSKRRSNRWRSGVIKNHGGSVSALDVLCRCFKIYL